MAQLRERGGCGDSGQDESVRVMGVTMGGSGKDIARAAMEAQRLCQHANQAFDAAGLMGQATTAEQRMRGMNQAASSMGLMGQSLAGMGNQSAAGMRMQQEQASLVRRVEELREISNSTVSRGSVRHVPWRMESTEVDLLRYAVMMRPKFDEIGDTEISTALANGEKLQVKPNSSREVKPDFSQTTESEYERTRANPLERTEWEALHGRGGK